MAAEERLQKYLARCGIASRRASEDLIRSGRVKVDGKIVTVLGLCIDADMQKISVDDKRVKPPHRFTYVLLNKPAGFVTTLSDEKGRPTVMDLIDVKAKIKPVGRLDFNTEGLLLLTDDGALIERLTHPRFGVDKTYRAKVRGAVDKETTLRLESGLFIEGSKTAPAKVRLINVTATRTVLEITVKEGRKRMVRKMLQMVGHPVEQLKRISFASLPLGNLPRGKWRLLSDQEVDSLRRATKSDHRPRTKDD